MKSKTPVGRPSFYDGRMVNYTVSLDAQSVDLLRELGQGNLSAGIREAARRISVAITQPKRKGRKS